MKKWLTLITVFIVAGTFSHAQTLSDKNLSDALDMMLATQLKATEPGAEVLVYRKGTIVYKKAFGVANLELNVPVTPDMIFRLGSITKQFTSVAILQLVEQGKINLQDSIQKYIPDFPSKGYTITIENLLTHTSGIKDYLQIEYGVPYLERHEFTPRQLVDTFKNVPLEFEPGTRYSYSNSGYFLLGYIIENVSGKSYPEYIRENILKPLGLTHTWFDEPNLIIPGRVSGYKKEDDLLKQADFWSMSIAYSAGGMLSNVEDLLKWHQGLYSYKILKKETLDKALVPFKLKDGTPTEYGYGWIIKNTNGISSIEHGGAITGFLSNEIYYPDDDIFIALLFNCDCAPSNVLSVMVPTLALGKSLQKETRIDPKIFKQYVGTYALMPDLKRTIDVRQDGDHLEARVSEKESYKILFATETKFELQNVLGATGEFIKENGVVTKFIISQNGMFEWKKIK